MQQHSALVCEQVAGPPVLLCCCYCCAAKCMHLGYASRYPRLMDSSRLHSIHPQPVCMKRNVARWPIGVRQVHVFHKNTITTVWIQASSAPTEIFLCVRSSKGLSGKWTCCGSCTHNCSKRQHLECCCGHAPVHRST